MTALRGVALFLGAFAATNAVLALAGGADANRWWIDLRGAPPWIAHPALLAAGTLLVAWAVRPAMHRARRAATCAFAAGLCLLTALDAAAVLRLDADDVVRTAGLPMSLVLAGLFAAIAVASLRTPAEDANRRLPGVAACAAVAAGLFPLAQMATFGRSDYRRDADAIVVFGARTYADGRASLALADRMRTACGLWHERRAPVVFLSGGPGDGATHETEAMRRIATEAGVPADALVLDPAGVNSRATAQNAAAWMRATGRSRAIAVSHAYHLPRVRMEFDRTDVRAFTVPAEESRFLGKMPWFVAREVAAWWAAWAAEAAGAE